MRPQFWGHGVWDKLAAVREASEMVGRELEDESSTQRLLRKVAALEWAQSLTVGLVEEVVAELDGALGAIGTGAAPGLGPSTELLLVRRGLVRQMPCNAVISAARSPIPALRFCCRVYHNKWYS